MKPSEVSILIVDDVNAVRVQFMEILHNFGFQKLRTASNGEEAKYLLAVEPIHLILADWHMAPTSGLDLLKYMKQHAAYQMIPFIMISAESTRARVMEAVEGGVDDYIMKPLTPNLVQTRVFNTLFKKGVFT